jgi:hypothetical protein
VQDADRVEEGEVAEGSLDEGREEKCYARYTKEGFNGSRQLNGLEEDEDYGAR